MQNKKTEFGDFQTPLELASTICEKIKLFGFQPHSIIEPTCGIGNFILVSLKYFPFVKRILGYEINKDYVCSAINSIKSLNAEKKVVIECADFFGNDWENIITRLQKPFLVLGNPPWVTNSKLGVMKGSNLPDKKNFYKYTGFEAITGKSNFDISEWMIIRKIHWISGQHAALAILCKTSVVRKVLLYAWKHDLEIKEAKVFFIDTKTYFKVAVDACLFWVVGGSSSKKVCQVYRHINDDKYESLWGFDNGKLISDIASYNEFKHLEGDSPFKWRSGIKHDCSKVMELRSINGLLVNGLKEVVEIEDDYIYPMYKSSDISKNKLSLPSRCMIVTQQHVGQSTNVIQQVAPKTWAYLSCHSELLNKRASSIYNRSELYAIFGVGNYTFLRWKVAISGFYKKLDFKVVPPYQGKPVVLDDTCYFLYFDTREEAELICRMLNSDISKNFFSSRIFWDNKRPITVSLLSQLDLLKLAIELGLKDEFTNGINIW